MATGYIWNSFGKYENRDGELGISLLYAGMNIWLPYEKVTPIPNWTLREVDHNASTPEKGEIGELVYRTSQVNGAYIVDFLCNQQVPVKNSDRGIIPIDGKPTGKMLTVISGCSEDGVVITSEVPEREAIPAEKTRAAKAAKSYKEQVVADYFQSKRERMMGGRGKTHPAAIERTYMDELGVEDIDDITTHQKTGGLDAGILRLIIEEVRKSTEVNTEVLRDAIATVRRAGNEPQLAKAKPKSLGLAEHKARKEAEEAAQNNG